MESRFHGAFLEGLSADTTSLEGRSLYSQGSPSPRCVEELARKDHLSVALKTIFD